MSGAALSFEMIAKIIAVMFQTNECAGPISEVYYNLRAYRTPGTVSGNPADVTGAAGNHLILQQITGNDRRKVINEIKCNFK